jgi:hypothetical protein
MKTSNPYFPVTFDHAPIAPLVPSVPTNPRFSFFRAPITNTQPHSRATLRQIYNAIRGDYYKPQTDKLRTITDPQQARKFKSQNFDYCTFSGIFTTRSDKAMLSHSGLMCFDFDNISDLKKLRYQLQSDQYLFTQLLFISPSGNGLKWIISIEPNQHTHANYFHAISDYLKSTYNVEVDKSGKDLSRACFLPHDPYAYINPYQLQSHEQRN